MDTTTVETEKTSVQEVFAFKRGSVQESFSKDDNLHPLDSLKPNLYNLLLALLRLKKFDYLNEDNQK
ncbi:MAG TPA: hypothetical protein VI461_11940 [Chitinophagaceae bacterium]|nr:hypothetical protein [Chitinophagaceae bacterium]